MPEYPHPERDFRTYLEPMSSALADAAQDASERLGGFDAAATDLQLRSLVRVMASSEMIAACRMAEGVEERIAAFGERFRHMVHEAVRSGLSVDDAQQHVKGELLRKFVEAQKKKKA